MQRVTVKRNYPVNDLLLFYLNELKEIERSKGETSRLWFTYKNAFKSLKSYPLEIKETDELRNLIFFGDMIIAKLSKKLGEFRKQFGEPTLETIQMAGVKSSMTKEKAKTKKREPKLPAANDLKQTSSISTKKEFTPQKGSGSYAMLRALYDAAIFNGGYENGGLLLEDLRQAADLYSREAMLKNSATHHYTPFSCLTILTKKDLIQRKKDGRKDMVYLTESGFRLAESLTNEEPGTLSEANGNSSSVEKPSHSKTSSAAAKISSIGKKRTAKTVSNGQDKDILPPKNGRRAESPKPLINAQLTFDLSMTSDDIDVQFTGMDQKDEPCTSSKVNYSPTLPLADRLALRTKTSLPTSWCSSQLNFESSASVPDYASSVQNESDGYIFVTAELTEVFDKSKSCREVDQETGLDVVWIKATQTYLQNRTDILYTITNNGSFEPPFVLAKLFEAHADEVAPGLSKTRKEVPQQVVPSIVESESAAGTSYKTTATEKKKEEVGFGNFEFPSMATSIFRQTLDKPISTIAKQVSLTDTSEFAYSMAPNSFDIILLVDCAEIKGGVPMTGEKSINRRDLLGEYLNQKNVLYEARKLNVGDYAWIARKRHSPGAPELILDLVMERKRVDDLLKSIRDGRWKSQKYRLKRCGLRKVMYLFEALPKSVKYMECHDASLRSAIINTEIQDGFFFEKRAHFKDTAGFIANVTKFIISSFKHKRLRKRKFNEDDDVPESDGILDLDSPVVDLYTFDDFQRLADKPRKFSVDDMLILTLMNISGVSVEMAKAIGDRFGSLANLIRSIDLCGVDESAKIKLFQDLKSGAQGRCLGKEMAKKIVALFSK